MTAYGKYQNAYKRASVNTMDQNKLIIMLYDGAIKNINFALEQMRTGDVEKVHNHLVKSKNIIAELMASLNMEKGGDIAKNLRSLYSYMFGQLIEANMKKDSKPAQVVRNLLMELREAWIAIGKKGSTSASAPGPQPGTRQPLRQPLQPGQRQPLQPGQRQPLSGGDKRINIRS